MTLKLNRSFILFSSVLCFVLLVAYGLYDWWRGRMLEHPATVQALELVREHPAVVDELGAEPPIWKMGGWVNGAGFIKNEDRVEIRLTLKGSVGEAVLTMEAERIHGEWQHSILRVENLDGELLVDLTQESQVEQLRESAQFSTRLSEGQALAKDGKLEEAIAAYREVFDGQGSPEQIVEARRLWGIALQQLGEYEDAETVLLDALARMLAQEGFFHEGFSGDTGHLPDSKDLRQDWEAHLSNLSLKNEVVQLAEWMETIESLGLTYRYRRQHIECIQTFKRLTAMSSDEFSSGFIVRALPRVHAHLGYCYAMAQGREVNALFHFEQACKLDKREQLPEVCDQVCRLNPKHPECQPRSKKVVFQ